MSSVSNNIHNQKKIVSNNLKTSVSDSLSTKLLSPWSSHNYI